MTRKSSRIKIIVQDKKSNFNLWLPSIPFWLISSLTSFAFIFKPIMLRKSNMDQDISNFIRNLDSRTIKELLHQIRDHGRFDLVDISTGDGTIVKISVL